MADIVDAAVAQSNLSNVLERITDGFFALDAQWRFTYINAEARKLLGGLENVIGMHYLDAFPKARGRLFEREYARAMREQRPVQFVEYSKTANCWFEVRAYPSNDGVSVYFHDVSARIEAQREVERNAQRLEALVDFGRTSLSGGGRARTVSASIELMRRELEAPIVEVLDYDAAHDRFTVRDCSGWPPSAVYDPSQPVQGHLLYAVHTHEPFVSSDLRIDPRARGLGGLVGAGVVSCIAVSVESTQRIAGAIVAYDLRPRTFSVGDVRFMESIAQTLAESNEAYESNHRTEQVLESITDGFVAVDRDLRITYVNGHMSRYWGETPEQVIGRPISEYTRDFDPHGTLLAQFKDAVANARPSKYEVEFRGSLFEGRVYPFNNGAAAYVRDITRRKDAASRIGVDLTGIVRDLDGIADASQARTRLVQLIDELRRL